MRHNQDNDHHREEHLHRRRDGGDPRQRQAAGRPNNNPQDRWPDFDESRGSNKLHGRPENLQREHRYYNERFSPDNYAFNEQDPRYMDEQAQRRREMLWEEQEREARRQDHRNQYFSDRWQEPEQYPYRGQEGRRPRPRDYDNDRRDHYENPGR